MASEIEPPLVLPPNTAAWTFQCWASFVIAMVLLTRGVWSIQIDPWVRGFMMIAFFYTIGSTFTLSKTLRDNRVTAMDTPAWIFFAWANFAISMIATFTGVYWLPTEIWPKSFFVAAFFFQINSSFALSKTVRDNFEAEQRQRGF